MAPVGDGIPVKPLIAHGTDNGFPSDHGLLAALVVAAVLLLGIRYIAPLVVLGVLVDGARVGAGTSLPGRGGTGHAYAEMAQHSGDCARNCLGEGRLEPG